MELNLALRRLALAAALCFGSGEAAAQCTGVFPANTLCGNLSASPAPPSAFSASSGVIGPNPSTLNGLPFWANTLGTQLGDANGHTIAGNYTWSGTQTYSNTNNFAGTFQINGVTITWPGIQTNTLSTKTANYTIASTDCGKTIQAGTGTTGLFTVTLPSVAGFSTTCSVQVTNGDTGRGKTLSGFPGDLFTTLWPLQTLQVQIINGAWATSINPGRWKPITTNFTFFIDVTNGSDANDGLAAGAGNAFKTIQHGYDILRQQASLSAQLITLQLAAGTYPENVTCSGPPVGAWPSISLVGDATTPTNVVWTPGTGLVGFFANIGCVTQINGVAFRPGAGTPCAYLDAFQGGVISFLNVDFGTLPASAGCGEHILVGHGGTVNAIGNYTISGSMTYHILAVADSTFEMVVTTISMPNALTFTNFISISGPANINFDQTTTFSGPGSGGGSTGSKFSINLNGALFTNSSTLPGTIAGVLATGGCADSACAALVNAYCAVAVNFNVGAADTAFPVSPPTANYAVDKVILANASASISTATVGVYSAIASGGTVVVTTAANTVTSAAANTANNMQYLTLAGSIGTVQSLSFTTLYVHIGTPQGSPATADVCVYIRAIS